MEVNFHVLNIKAKLLRKKKEIFYPVVLSPKLLQKPEMGQVEFMSLEIQLNLWEASTQVLGSSFTVSPGT